MSNKTGVIYFSKDGSTKLLAALLAEKHSAETIELKVKDYKSNMIMDSVQATGKKSAELEDKPYDNIAGYDKIYLCTPIWASNGTPAMNAFIENADFTDKEVVIITVKAFMPTGMLKGTHEYLANNVMNNNGKVIDCFDVHGAVMGKTASAAHIKDQIDRNNI